MLRTMDLNTLLGINSLVGSSSNSNSLFLNTLPSIYGGMTEYSTMVGLMMLKQGSNSNVFENSNLIKPILKRKLDFDDSLATTTVHKKQCLDGNPILPMNVKMELTKTESKPAKKKSRGKLCRFDDCTKLARGGGLCKKHGGGVRCSIKDCPKSARSGCNLCTAHGGGRRCKFENCGKGAEGSSFYCVAHGGGKKCTFAGCTKKDQGSGFCKAHGGGKRCMLNDCNKSVKPGHSLCTFHYKFV